MLHNYTLLFYSVENMQITTCPQECFGVVRLCIWWDEYRKTCSLLFHSPPFGSLTAGTDNQRECAYLNDYMYAKGKFSKVWNYPYKACLWQEMSCCFINVSSKKSAVTDFLTSEHLPSHCNWEGKCSDLVWMLFHCHIHKSLPVVTLSDAASLSLWPLTAITLTS